jgi:nucleoid-associated protein YejK
MMTEIEYIKCLQDNSTTQNNMNESSFFKSFINVEKGGGSAQAEEKVRLEELHDLRESNDLQKKKMVELQKLVEELE